MLHADTIAAVSTAAGPAGIGVVRVSGPDVRKIIGALTGRDLPPRLAVLCEFNDAGDQALDRGIALFFPGPNSYTGEDLLELQGHGGPAVLKLVLRRCFELGARPAQPGEFTQRAFLNGKLDLAQAEGVADLINAGSEAAARGAMRSLSGEFSEKIRGLVKLLVALRVHIEASIDFPEEGLDPSLSHKTSQRIEILRAQLAKIIDSAEQGRLLRDGVRIVLIGRPNVGKSSLMNRLAQEDVSIVSEIPGTTRDLLRHDLIIEGIPIHLADTAGLRDSADPVEKIGIARAWQEANLADLAIIVMEYGRGETSEDKELIARLPKNLRLLRIFNKIDLSSEQPGITEGGETPKVKLSAKTGDGMDLAKKILLQMIGWRPLEETQLLARERHVAALKQANKALTNALALSELDLIAEELRVAQNSLARVTGEFSSEDLLGEIFSSFCIGK
ncbi:MAG: tRNA uridine-5-carboxymethylaminomethyl(34) synthesis GTPase MnmE [Burkholderiales bacterium]